MFTKNQRISIVKKVTPQRSLILIVDDDQEMRAATAMILERVGYVVMQGANAAEALALTRAHHPDLVLLDVELPDGDGLEVARRLKADPELLGTLVVFLSGSKVSAEDQSKGLMEGNADGYIVHPVAPKVLCGWVEAFLRLQATQVALRKSEEELKQAQAMAHVGNFSYSIAIDTIRWSHEVYRLFGVTPVGRSMQFKDVERLIHPEDLEYWRTATQRSIAAGRSVVTENRVVRPDGTIRHHQVLSRVRLSPDGRPLEIVGTVQDITERKRAEEEQKKLQEQNLQLQKSESLGRMAGAIAHHFNNQLASVMLNLDILEAGLPQDAELTEPLVSAMQSVREAAKVSNLMLTYLGQTHGVNGPMDLSVTCQRSLELLRAAMPQSVVLETHLPSPGPTINANSSQIQQILTNLVTNAWEASVEGRGTIQVAVKTVLATEIPATHRFPVDWQAHDNTVYACLEVTDAGCGIADKDLEKIFDPFYSSKFTGRGMGLAVVLGIVRTCQGVVTVASTIGRGSVFQVILPISFNTIPAKSDQTAQASIPMGGGALLLVEDETNVRHAVTKVLRRLGFTVLAAADGREGVEIFRQHQAEIRCVLCDLTMPRMNGWQTLAALRQLSPEIPFILSSGYDEAQAMAGQYSERPQAFLSKPYMVEDLYDVLAKVLGKNSFSGSQSDATGG